jgi:hypothetical protein
LNFLRPLKPCMSQRPVPMPIPNHLANRPRRRPPRPPGHVLILRSASRHQPGREGRKAPRTYAHTAIPADLLMGNYCEQVVHSRYIHWDSSPRAAGWSSVAGRRGRSPAVGTYEGWMTSYGVYGHLLDSLSAWGHSVTLFKPEQARFGRLYASMFFRKASPQTEGRRDADLKIKT